MRLYPLGAALNGIVRFSSFNSVTRFSGIIAKMLSSATALQLLVPFLSLLRPVSANTCSQIGALNVSEVKLSQSSEYSDEQNNYWSMGCSALKPSCILYPTSASEVATIIQILNDNNETFALKSGGHNPNEGFSSIQSGPLISTKQLNEVTFDPASMTVRVGPGNDWEDVHKALEGTNVTVVGGRIGEVGVGGYVVGGGLSFLSTQYGWAANNIVSFEVVLANATIVTASNTTHPDLYRALKGGGNNFGVVTAYNMIAHPMGQVSTRNILRCYWLIFTRSGEATCPSPRVKRRNCSQRCVTSPRTTRTRRLQSS
jgi:FAD/FMN-containing dehydrogenase